MRLHLSREEARLHHLDNDVDCGHMRFLHAVGRSEAVNHQFVVASSLEFTPTTQKSDYLKPSHASCLNGSNNIL